MSIMIMLLSALFSLISSVDEELAMRMDDYYPTLDRSVKLPTMKAQRYQSIPESLLRLSQVRARRRKLLSVQALGTGSKNTRFQSIVHQTRTFFGHRKGIPALRYTSIPFYNPRFTIQLPVQVYVKQAFPIDQGRGEPGTSLSTIKTGPEPHL